MNVRAIAIDTLKYRVCKTKPFPCLCDVFNRRKARHRIMVKCRQDMRTVAGTTLTILVENDIGHCRRLCVYYS